MVVRGLTNRARGILILTISLASAVGTSADESLPLAFAHTDGKVVVTAGEHPLITYVYQDPHITRPYFYHAHAPGGIQVTRNFPPIEGQDATDHADLHPGLWLAFGDISGSDYWRLKARVQHAEFLQLPQGKGDSGGFAVRNRYLAHDDPSRTICQEDCRFTFYVQPRGYWLIWDSTFTSDMPFAFGDQEEMGLGVRVASPISVDKGGHGRILDSARRRNGKEVWGQASEWVDYSGPLQGRFAGVAVMTHPGNLRPSRVHARDYGFMAVNLFGRAWSQHGEPYRLEVKAGEPFRLRYGVWLHAGTEPQHADVSAAYQEYLQRCDK